MRKEICIILQTVLSNLITVHPMYSATVALTLKIALFTAGLKSVSQLNLLATAGLEARASYPFSFVFDIYS